MFGNSTMLIYGKKNCKSFTVICQKTKYKNKLILFTSPPTIANTIFYTVILGELIVCIISACESCVATGNYHSVSLFTSQPKKLL